MFPHHHQLEARDCAPTCLRIISSYYGKNYSAEELRDICAITKQGASLQDIIDAAKQLGLDTLSLKIAPEKISEIPLPAILYWRQEHYVVLYEVKKKKHEVIYKLSDPGFGRVILKEDLFIKQWLGANDDGITLLLEPNEEFYKKIPQKISPWKPLVVASRIFFDTFRNNSVKSAAAILLVLVAMVCTWLFPSIFRKMIDNGVLLKNMNIVFSLLVAQLVIFLSQTLADSLSTIFLMQLNFKVSITFLVSYLNKLIRLPLKVFDNKVNSDLMLRMEDNDRIQSFLTHQVLEFLISFISLIIFSVMLFHYKVIIFELFFLISIMSVSWTVLFLKRRKVLDYARFSVSSETRNNIYELINEMPEIKINNAHHNKIFQWEKLQHNLNQINLKALFLNYYQLIGSNFFNRSKDIAITGLCAYYVIHGQMTLGVMLTIGYILGQLNRPIDNLIMIIRGLQDAQLSVNRLHEIQILKEENDGKTEIQTVTPQNEIRLSNVSFKYEGTFNPMVLKNISLTIPIGKITAIVGSSGSGKTTLLKLLLAIYDPTDGKVLLDKQDLANVVPDSWRTRCGVVLQDGFIYSGTYADNIALADEDPDLDKVVKAAQIACIDEFIDSLPMKYNTKIGNVGVNLSGGQKQRILIARAIYRDPEFIFFDEATSSLDANNEMLILNNLKNYFIGRTVVVVAHRLSTVKNADQIIVIEKGTIVEQDSHEDLIKKKGRYFELVKNQLELGD